ncbi:SMC-Scp complex subunit ScpB [Rothia sp. P5766]|uniref:SMC-Scp complex subunit ScpB n=1 Tax=unclassified Rothia (in: high G+C Gram-positive bacteria) TaxID=2689056 RepID=UPI003AD921E7
MGSADFTDDDLRLLTSGSWSFDPGESTPESAEGTTDADKVQGEETPTPEAPQDQEALPPQTASPNPRRKSRQEPVLAASSDGFSRVELQPGGIKAAIEAILAVADVPVSVREFSAALIVSERAVETALDELDREYKGYDDGTTVHEPRGFELRQVGGGWRLYSRQDFSPWVGRFVVGAQSTKLTRAALETLAVIAYQQPATRSYLAQVRGVSVDAAVRNLLHRGLIAETVPDETGATQYITTDTLLEKLGLNSLDELPALAPYLPDPAEVNDHHNIDLNAG